MTTYPQRVRDNILPLSLADALPEAFKEWHFTEETIDHKRPIETCQLCDKEQLRYHFEIANDFTQKYLWVGSKCILQFGISVLEDGQPLGELGAKKKLDRLVQQMRLRSCLEALGALVEQENDEMFANAMRFYERHKYLTPKFAFVVLWRLKTHGIDHSPSFFKISLKKDKYKTDLRDMPDTRIQLIWPALSPAQRLKAIEMGHSEPKR